MCLLYYFAMRRRRFGRVWSQRGLVASHVYRHPISACHSGLCWCATLHAKRNQVVHTCAYMYRSQCSQEQNLATRLEIGNVRKYLEQIGTNWNKLHHTIVRRLQPDTLGEAFVPTSSISEMNCIMRPLSSVASTRSFGTSSLSNFDVAN